MKLLEKIKRFYRNYLKCPGTETFDDEFQKVLQIFYAFGWYHPSTPSTGRKVYGALTFAGVLLTNFAGALRETIMGFQEGNLNKALMNGMALMHSISIITQILSLIMNKTKALKLMRKLHTLHVEEEMNFERNEAMIALRRNCLQMIKFYKYVLALSATILIVPSLFGFGFFKLAFPAIYDVFAEGSLRQLLLAVNIFHSYCYAFIIAAVDMYLIFCMMRIETNINFLCNKVGNCTENFSFRANEREANDCVDYHVAILE
jgi:7tm Odorant receptor